MRNQELVTFLQNHQPTQATLREAYGIQLAQAELLKDNFNLVYAWGDHIVRLSRATKKDLAEIRSELKWLQFLGDCNLPVTRVVPAATGESYLSLSLPCDTLYCVVFTRLAGETMRPDHWGIDHFRALGHLAGRLHRASIDFTELVDEDFRHWHEQSKCAAFHHLPKDNRRLPELWRSVHEKIVADRRDRATYGVIHYDIHYGNYLLTFAGAQQHIGLYDFEMTCRGWYLQDIAVILYYASNRNSAYADMPRLQFEADFLEAFRDTYARHMPELVFDETAIQAHLLYRDLFVYAYVLEAWRGRELSVGDRQLMKRLEKNIAERRAGLE